MLLLLDVILPVFLIIGAGYAAVWRGWFKDDWVEGLMRFTQGYAIPCMTFRAVAQMNLSNDFEPAMLASFYIGAVCGFLAALLGARFLFKRPWTDSVAIGFVGLFSNSVLLGLPISERAWGPEAVASNFTIIAFHAAFCYGIGLTAMEVARNAGGGLRAAAPRILKAMFRNPLILAMLLGVTVNLTGLGLPKAGWDAIDMLSRAALPAALFGLGGTLYRYRPEGDIPTILYVTAVSLILHPAITYGLARLLEVSDEGLRSAVITSAMAPGINAYMFAAMYGVAKRVAASTVLIGTALTVLTAWGWLHILP
ncbi:AEC family transporter [Falsigemmobacter intermedius]|uniref:AEC family transporter n=1 Tax=Falsigemmobacter intermedius TaxID=1553448 RepID=A0A444MCS4_9RHOB|nr:AEC family transporter [Falsigemmobacter intermedius]RWY42156.1 AEC family transporter [Falsigemmobacter intermedius]